MRIPAYIFLLGLAVFIPNEELVFWWMPVFAFGIAYVGIRCGVFSRRESIALITLIAVTCAVINGWAVLFVAAGTLLLIHFSQDKNLPGFGKLGAVSYSLYLMHTITGTPVINFLSHRVENPFAKFGVVLFGSGISLVAAYMLYFLVEKPSMKWSKQFTLK